MRHPSFMIGLALAFVGTEARSVELAFRPLDSRFDAAAQEYVAIWQSDGARIVAALDTASGVTLPPHRIDVVVYEGMSRSGRTGESMYLRASNPRDTKRAVLVHELAHRYVAALELDPRCFDDVHDVIAPLLIDVWTELWGEAFLTAQATVESGYSERYRRAWGVALASRGAGDAVGISKPLAACPRTPPAR